MTAHLELINRTPSASWNLGSNSWQKLSWNMWGVCVLGWEEEREGRIASHLSTFSTPILSPHWQFWLISNNMLASFPQFNQSLPTPGGEKEPGFWRAKETPLVTSCTSTDRRAQLRRSWFGTRSELTKRVSFRQPRGDILLRLLWSLARSGDSWLCRLRNQDFQRKLRNVSTSS